MKGSFITFEGIDGSGKTTQLKRLAKSLRQAGRDVVETREPGGTPLGIRLRTAFLESDSEVEPLAELLLFAADRAQHIHEVIRPSLAAGKIVLSDRYADATTAYQGAGRGFNAELVARVVSIATEGLVPGLTLFFDIPPETAADRMAFRHPDKRNRMDDESIEFYTRVREKYLEIAAGEPARFRVIDGERAVEAIAADTLKQVTEYLARV